MKNITTCVGCGRKLLHHDIINGIVEIKCRISKCGIVNQLICANGICVIQNKFEDETNLLYNIKK